MQNMKDADWDKIWGDGENQLDLKEAAVLNKYLLAAMQFLSLPNGDPDQVVRDKVKLMVNFNGLLKQQLAMNQHFGMAVIYKSLSERNPIIGGVKVPE